MKSRVLGLGLARLVLPWSSLLIAGSFYYVLNDTVTALGRILCASA